MSWGLSLSIIQRVGPGNQHFSTLSRAFWAACCWKSPEPFASWKRLMWVVKQGKVTHLSLLKHLTFTTLFWGAVELHFSPSDSPMWDISVWVRLRLKHFPKVIPVFFFCPVCWLSHNSSMRYRFCFVIGDAGLLKRQIKQLAVDSAKGKPRAIDANHRDPQSLWRASSRLGVGEPAVWVSRKG